MSELTGRSDWVEETRLLRALHNLSEGVHRRRAGPAEPDPGPPAGDPGPGRWQARRSVGVFTAILSLVVAGAAGVAAAAPGAPGGSAPAPAAKGGPAGASNPAPPPASGWPTSCTEGSFLTTTPATGAPGQKVHIATYFDETPINQSTFVGKNGVTQTPPEWGVTDASGTWTAGAASAISMQANSSVQNGMDLFVTIPTGLAPGTDTGWLIAFDSDANKAGGDCGIAKFSITITSPPTHTLAGHIFLCQGGVATTSEVPGGTLRAFGSSGAVVSPRGNPLSVGVSPAGQWTVAAAPPTNYSFTACTGAQPATGGALPTVTSDTAASVPVNVPSGGTGTAYFYVTLNTPVVQHLAGHIYACASGLPTVQEVPGGTMQGSGPGTVSPTGNPMLVGVAAGSWVVSATAPGGTQFVTCGGVPASGTTASQVVNVPSGGTGTAVFYVATPSTFNVNLTKSVSATQVTAGQGFTYTLVATNTGAAPAPGVVVTDAVPAKLGISGTPTASQGSCSVSGNNVTCNLGTLAALGGSATITINVTTTTASCGVVNDTGQVTALGGTTGSSNTVTTTIICPAITVGVVKGNNAQDPTGSIFGKTEPAKTLGETFSYRVEVTNTSSVSEVVGTLTDSIPGQPAEDVCTTLVGTVLQPGASVPCTFPGLAPSTSGVSVTDTITVTVTQQGDPSQSGRGSDISTVYTGPGVVITKANNAAGTGFGTSETVAAGATSVPYQVVVTNPNSVPGTITSLTDTISGSAVNICPELLGTVLQPGASVTCNFSTGVPATVTTDTAAVTLTVNGTPVSATAQSTVFPPVLGTVIAPTTTAPATLAFTGTPVRRLVALALASVAAGLMILAALQVADERRRYPSRFRPTD